MARNSLTRPVVTRDGSNVLVAMPGQDTPATRKDARTLCQREVGTVAIGALQDTTQVAGGHVYVFTPNLARMAKPVAEVNVANVMAEVEAESDARLAAYAVEDTSARLDRLEGAILALTEAVAALAGAKAPKASAAPKAPKAPSSFVAEVIAPRAAKRAVVTCATCQDHGVVRGSGPRAGQPFRTANGAAMAPTAVPCPTHKRARKSA